VTTSDSQFGDVTGTVHSEVNWAQDQKSIQVQFQGHKLRMKFGDASSLEGYVTHLALQEVEPDLIQKLIIFGALVPAAVAPSGLPAGSLALLGVGI